VRIFNRFLTSSFIAIMASTMGLAVTTAQDDSLVFVLVSHGGGDIDANRPIIEGIEDACALLEAECHWFSDPFFNFEDMAGYWEEALALDPDAIATSAVRPRFVRAGVEQALERGIPVISFNIEDPAAGTEEALPTLLYVGPNEFGASQNNARRVLAEAEGDGTTIQRGVCINPFPEIAPLHARCEGAQQVFEEAGIPFDYPELSPDQNEALRQLTAYFAEHPESNAVFGTGPGQILLLQDYMRQADIPPGTFYATTHDVVPEVQDMIRDGLLIQTAGQQPYMQGFQTVMSLYLLSQFGARPGENLYTSIVVDANNVDEARDLFTKGAW
jgi:simple sugar transport system substrate-binding protein